MIKVKELYIIRHGETDYNLKKIVQGSGVDASLNENGRLQAQAFYKHYHQEGFDKIYISALKRTKESVASFIEDNIPFESLIGLNEISWGAREGNPFTAEENEYYYSILNRWRNGETHLPVEDGESPDAVALRQREALKHIMAQTDESKVLICMHGRAMRILLTQLFNYPISNMDMFPHQNLGLYKVRATGNQFQLVNHNERAF